MERLKGMLFGSFVGDAFSLNVHWIYDTDKLMIEAQSQEDYVDPSKNLFHAHKHKGDFTHYGDQSLLLLKSISANKGFDLVTFQTNWLTYMQKYEGYVDHATKESMALLDQHNHKGSSSDELGGFSRCFPLIFYHFDDPKLHDFVEAQTRMTHDNENLIQISHFLTDLTLELIIGKPLNESIDILMLKYPQFKTIFDRLKAHQNDDTIEFVKDIGQSCTSEYAFPATMYLILKYEHQFAEALRLNNLCGGDSASRGIIIGAILGLIDGYHAIPEHLIKHLNDYSTIESFSTYKRL